jgi:hypothetical protein
MLRYLGLPGDDLLDLRYFHSKICVPKNLKLKYLGFNHGANQNSEHGTELNISLHEVNRLELIDPSSNIIGDDFCKIADLDSNAWEQSKKMGPYDIINIDLCDGFGKHPVDDFKETHYNTLSQLMTLQCHRATPWLLLITTRTGDDHINENVFNLLASLYKQKLSTCTDFQVLSNDVFKISDDDTFESMIAEKPIKSKVFLTAMCTWIANLGSGYNPPSKIELKSALGYKVDLASDHEDLVSIAIKIEPTFIPSQDKLGLAKSNKKTPDECSISAQVLNRMSKLGNVDDILDSDNDLMEEMIAMSASLLEQARYETSDYAAWAREK